MIWIWYKSWLEEINIGPMYTTFEEKLLFVEKTHMYGVRQNSIYVLLGDLLSMYAVNRNSGTAC